MSNVVAIGGGNMGITGGMNERHEEIASALPVELDSLPRLSGFRLRGIQMPRLETFIDTAFAFSIAVLSIFWRGHWLWSRRYGLEDGASILISWTMIVTILIFIYPLKAIFGSMWYYLSDGQVGQRLSLHTTESQARTIFAIYALGTIAVSAEILLLNLRAWQLRKPLRLNARERLVTCSELTGWSIPVNVGIVSLVLALTVPTEKIAWSGWVYFSIFILFPLHDAYYRRRMAREC